MNDISAAAKFFLRLVAFAAAWSISWIIFGVIIRLTADLFCIGFRC